MAFDVNKQILVGKLGADAEHRVTPNGTNVASFSLATTHSYKGKDGNYVNNTTWHNCIGYNLSDFYRNELVKGAKFYVEGRTDKREYEDKSGVKRYVTEVIVERLLPLSDRRNNHVGAPSNEEAPHAPVSGQGAPQAGLPSDDDLPF